VRYRFIINRHSGRKIGNRRILDMEKYFQSAIGSFEYVLPEGRDDAIRLTRESLKEGFNRIIAVGGDGTVNAVVNGFFENGKPINSGASLVVTREGSGWDYYSSITKYKNTRNWMYLVTDSEVRAVDVGYASYGDTALTGQYFVNMASIGLTAEIVEKKEKASDLIHINLRYILPTMVGLFEAHPKEVEIVMDNETVRREVLAVTVSKGSYAGNGMNFGLEVALDDGRFEVTVIEKSNPFYMLYSLGKLFTGNYLSVRGISKYSTKRLELRAPKPLGSEIDGELYGSTDMTIDLLPKALNVCFPMK